MQTWALILDSFRDAVDRKVFWIMLLIGVVIAATMACVGFNDQGVDIFFGAWTFETAEWSLSSEQLESNMGAVAVEVIADNYLGWIGIIIALVATASAFPSLMEPGNIDIVASKPISRHKLFLSRYCGAMVFILLQSVIFIGLTFVVMGVRWHYWSWGYLWLIPLMVLLFSYLFAFCALFGVWTRRSMTSLMLTMLAWFFLFCVQATHSLLITNPDFDKTGRWTRIATAMHWAVPKTQDIPIIAGKLMGAGLFVDTIPVDRHGMSQDDRAGFQQAADAQRKVSAAVRPLHSITSSLAAEALIVLLAMWRFNRRDF